MTESVVLPGKVAARIIEQLTEDNERLISNVNAITQYRAIENEALGKLLVVTAEVREIHHWVRLLDGTESCANCGPGYPCETIKCLNQGEEEVNYGDL